MILFGFFNRINFLDSVSEITYKSLNICRYMPVHSIPAVLTAREPFQQLFSSPNQASGWKRKLHMKSKTRGAGSRAGVTICSLLHG